MSAPVCDLDTFKQALTQAASHFSIALKADQLMLLSRHYELVCSANVAAGLTSVTDPSTSAIKHYLDSLTALTAVAIEPGATVLDVGTGAGFPGLVLAIMRPAAHYVLVEANNKRCDFLREAIQELALQQVAVVAERAETLGRAEDYRERFDLVVSRAVAPLPVLSEYCLPLVRIGGVFLALKGPGAEEELARAAHAITLLGGAMSNTVPVTLPNEMGERMLIVIAKTSPTPRAYPRKPGLPKKRPLG